MKLKPKSTTLNQRALLYRRYISINESDILKTVYRVTVGVTNLYWLFNKERLDFIQIQSSDIPNDASIIDITYQTIKYQDTYFRAIQSFVKGISSVVWRKDNSPKKITYTNLTQTWSVGNNTITLTGTQGNFGYIFFSNSLKQSITIKSIEIITTDKKYKIENQSIVIPAKSSKWIELTEVPSSTTITPSIVFSVEKSENGIITYGIDTIQTTLNQILSGKYANIGKYQINKYYYVNSFDFMIKGGISGTTTQYLKGNIIPLTSMSIKHYNDYVNLTPDDLVVINGRLYSVENPEVDHKHQPRDFSIYSATLNSIL